MILSDWVSNNDSTVMAKSPDANCFIVRRASTEKATLLGAQGSCRLQAADKSATENMDIHACQRKKASMVGEIVATTITAPTLRIVASALVNEFSRTCRCNP